MGNLHFAQGFGFATFITGGSSCFFDKVAAFLGGCFGNGADVALLDHGIGFGAQTAA